jgi:hypothetical protein
LQAGAWHVNAVVEQTPDAQSVLAPQVAPSSQ